MTNTPKRRASEPSGEMVISASQRKRSLEPRNVRPDGGSHTGGFENRREGLVGEDRDKNHGAGRQDRHDLRDRKPTRFAAGDQDLQDRPGSGDQGGDGDQSGRSGGERECGDQHGDRGGQQTSGGDGAFDGAPREQGAERDDRFGTQAVVVRQPEGQEDEPARPDGDLVGRTATTESRDHLAADDHPAQNAGDQRGQAHPHARGAHLREQRQHVVVPAERRFGDAEPAEVVGHVAGVLGDSGHAEQIAVVGRVGAERRATAASVPITTPSMPVNFHHRAGRNRRARRPSTPSRRCSAYSETRVESTATIIATSLSSVGLDEKRESTSMWTDSAGGRCALQVGEDADNLWPVVTGQGGADAVDSGDRRDGLLGVGRDGDRRAPAQLIERSRDQHRIASECFQAVGSGADGEAAGVSVRRTVRHGREQCAAAAAQLAEGGTGNADVERCGRVGDQRRRDAVDGPTLRPVDARGFLLDGQERRRECKKQAKKAGDYRDESCRPDSLGIRFSGSFGASGHGFRGHYYFRRHKERC